MGSSRLSSPSSTGSTTPQPHTKSSRRQQDPASGLYGLPEPRSQPASGGLLGTEEAAPLVSRVFAAFPPPVLEAMISSRQLECFRAGARVAQRQGASGRRTQGRRPRRPRRARHRVRRCSRLQTGDARTSRGAKRAGLRTAWVSATEQMLMPDTPASSLLAAAHAITNLCHHARLGRTATK